MRTCWWTAASADRGIGRSQPRCYHRAGLGPSGDARARGVSRVRRFSKGAHPLATDPGSPYRRLVRGPAIYVLVALAAIWLFLVFANRGATSDQLSFSEFQSEVAAGNVDTANFLLGDGVIEGELSDGTPYRVAYVQGTEETLTEDLQKNGVDISADPQKGSALVGFLFQLIPVILIVGAFIFIMNQSQGGGGRVMQFGKARAKLVTKDQPKTTFADVAGVDEAIEELQEVKEYLANPAKFQAMGAKIPRGVLLFGPPGSGKTLLARAVAGEAGVPFYSISGSDFVEMFVGVGAARVRDLFEQAKQSAPAIVFID